MKLGVAVKYLAQQQQPEGNFMSFASPGVEPFMLARQQPALFSTALILDCLQAVPGTAAIRKKAATYLQGQVSQQGSWNYWDSTSAAKIEQPYPDDLDDTACALAALTRQDSSWVDSHRLGQFARLLVFTETKVGGPYNTWLADLKQSPQWRHCDLAVNANIGYVLSQHGVCPSGLCSYIEAAIESDRLTSDYYVGEIPVLYFICRWYGGKQLPTLKTKLSSMLKAPPANALHQALLLSSGSRLGLPSKQLQPLADSLRANSEAGYWPAAALYIDPSYEGRQHYGGSAALTTAFVLEALHLFEGPRLDVNADTPMPSKLLSPLVRRDAASISNPQLRKRYLAMARQTAKLAEGNQIAGAASLVASATTWPLPASTIRQLDAASLNGWMAYTIYDNLLDGDQHKQQLNVANLALRRSYGYFSAAAGHLPEYYKYLQQTFDTIDGANDWELQNARGSKLPNYGDLSQLAERSWGHSLAAATIFGLHYGRMEHPQIEYLQTFFRHFLIARQLNDDAHDWEDDLRVGQLSVVVTMLLKGQDCQPGRIAAEQMEDLRIYFWQHTIEETSDLIRLHLAKAHQAVAKLEDISHGLFTGWLAALENAVKMAIKGRDDAVKFIDAYEDKHARV